MPEMEELAMEQQILGALILEGEETKEAGNTKLVGSVLKKEDFYGKYHQDAYEAILSLHNKGEPVTDITVAEYLKQAGKEEVPKAYLAELVDKLRTSRESVILYYARQIKEKSTLRKLGILSLKIQEATKDGKQSLEIIRNTEDELKVLTTEVQLEDFRYDKDIFLEITSELEARQARYEKGEKITGLRTGFKYLDDLLNGLQTSLYVLGGAPSVGKTSFCKQLADQVVVENQVPVVLITYEQSKFELILKSLSRMSRIDNLRLQKGNIRETEDLLDAESRYYEECAPYIVTIEGDAMTYLDKIKTYALRAMRDKEADKCLIVIDYLQVMPSKEEFKDKRTRVDHVLSELRRLARELSCPIWLVSSFSRKAYEHGKGQPFLDAFKESGNIEYTADVAILMEAEGMGHRGLNPTVKFRVIKNRNGVLGKVIFEFKPEFSEFSEDSKEELEEEYKPWR